MVYQPRIHEVFEHHAARVFAARHTLHGRGCARKMVAALRRHRAAKVAAEASA